MQPPIRDAARPRAAVHVPRAVVAGLCALAAGCLWQKEAPDLKDKDVRLTILHTSDIHSRLVPYDLAPLKTDRDLGLMPQAAPFGGVARIAGLVKRERARAERSILVDSGDCFQGAPIFNMNSGEAEIRFMSLLKPDGVVIGNHEFDAGARNFAQQAEQFARYPLLAANYDYTRADWDDPTAGTLGRISQPYSISIVDGLRIGIIGMANLGSLNSIVEGGNSMGITPLEQNETARAYVEYLQPMVDLVVVVSHLGLHEDQDLVRGYEAVYADEDQIKGFLERARDPWKVLKKFEDGRVEVFIPGVRGLDVIMGGHLHVVLNPPQVLKDPDGREVVISHSGAFAKYLGRLDLVINNGEVKAHTYKAFPVDSLWCMEIDERENLPPFSAGDAIEKMLAENKDYCAASEDAATHRLLDYYVLQMGQKLDLPMIFGYAPRNIERRNSSGGGDSPLGNLTADAMRRRQRVDAEFSVTNTLGIRDNLYAGPITLESMFNVFPFENTITIMYLSGREVQELMDFMTERSAGRGCQSQGQVAGATFTMDCGIALENQRLAEETAPEYRCEKDVQCACTETSGECRRGGAAFAGKTSPDEAKGWQCIESSCYRHPARDIVINGEPLNPAASYKIAVNDYIAKGGSGFKVLKRNTTRIDTGISLRDALIDSLRKKCDCAELESEDPEVIARCAAMFGGLYPADQAVVSLPKQCQRVKLPNSCVTALTYCETANTYEQKLEDLEAQGTMTFEKYQQLGETAYIYAGKCACHEVLLASHPPTGTPSAEEQEIRTKCGHVTTAIDGFCHNPRAYPVIATEEDGRIERRVK